MTSLSNTLARLASARSSHGAPGGVVDRLTDLSVSFANPGALRARIYVPPGLERGAALVVALHGCTQTAAAYDHGAGWSALADRQGFAVLLPEQAAPNNPNRCFNWFAPEDIARHGGEAESIAAMTAAALARHELDPARVFVTGLSAGGAMTAVMLATYPDLFAGGAIIGGLPYGCAATMAEAFARMRGQGGEDDARSLARVGDASGGYRGSRPSVSLWHGTADATVDIANLDRLGRQWRHVHDLGASAPAITTGPGWERRAWAGEDGRDLVEEWRIAGMGHGVPIDPAGPSRLGATGPYMLDVGLSSTAEIARRWGLMTRPDVVADPQPRPSVAAAITPDLSAVAKQASGAGGTRVSDSVQHTIERALRSAGLMR